MISSQKVVHLKSFSFFKLFIAPALLIGAFWLLFIGLTHLGVPFPDLPLDKFFDLGFFSLSTFGIIVFLTMVPFQAAEGKLSPIFYARIFNASSAHFGIYVLMWSFVTCFTVAALQEILGRDLYLNQLFVSLVASIAFAILFHRFWVLRCLYQPYIVNKYIETLKGDESNEEVWLELFECSFKAIKEGRVGDAKNFISLMDHVYNKCTSAQQTGILKEDLLSLYAIAQESRPIARDIEERWPLYAKRKQISHEEQTRWLKLQK